MCAFLSSSRKAQERRLAKILLKYENRRAAVMRNRLCDRIYTGRRGDACDHGFIGFFVSSAFSVCQRMWIAGILNQVYRTWYMPYRVRWQVLALPTLLY